MTYDQFLEHTKHVSLDDYTQYYFFQLNNIVSHDSDIKNIISIIIGDITKIYTSAGTRLKINGTDFTGADYSISICHPFTKYLQWLVKDPNYGIIKTGTTAVLQLKNPDYKYNTVYLGSHPIKGQAVDILLETFYQANEESLKQMKI